MFPPSNARGLAVFAISSLLRPGDWAIDATMGNGHDTLRMAQYVGETGRIFAFDVQAEALAATNRRLSEAGLLERVRLFHQSHAEMAACVPQPVRLLVFNLGWLPGSDKRVRTNVESTLAAVRAGLSLLAPQGAMLISVYPGHPEGKVELEALNKMLGQLDGAAYSVLHQNFLNYPAEAPQVFCIQKN